MKKTLAQFVQEKRDNLGLSPKGLAVRSNLDIEVIEDIEAGKELFLSVTVRQNLAKGLLKEVNSSQTKRLSKESLFCFYS